MKYVNNYDNFLFEGYNHTDINGAVNYINKNCKTWLNNFETNTVLYRIVNDNVDFSTTAATLEPRGSLTGTRTNALVDSLDSWKGWPKRSFSTFFRTARTVHDPQIDEYAVSWRGHAVVVIPKDGAILGACPGMDFNFSQSWPYMANFIRGNYTTKVKEMITRHFFAAVYNLIRRNHSVITSDSDMKLIMEVFEDIDNAEGTQQVTTAGYRKVWKMLDKWFVAPTKTDIVLDYQNNSIDSFQDSKVGLGTWINDVYSPKKNSFSKVRYSDKFNEPRNHEVWTEEFCIFVRLGDSSVEESPYEDLLKKL